MCAITPPSSQIYPPPPSSLSAPRQSSVILPAAPSNVQVVALGPSTLYVTWTPNSNNESGFDITRDQHFSPEGHVPTGTYSYVWDGLPRGGYVCIAVRAFNSAGSSGYSGWSCTTLPSS
ncbi:MAG: fibronectin type III domain-containing protein [Dehalococcoidia bacterium]